MVQDRRGAGDRRTTQEPAPVVRLRPRRLPGLVAVAVASVLGLLAVVLAAQDDDRQRAASAQDLVVATIPVGEIRGVRVLAEGDGAVYVASENDRRLYRIDTATNEVTEGPPLAVGDAVAVGPDGVYVLLDDPGGVVGLDPTTLARAGSAVLDSGAPVSVAMISGVLWVRTDDGGLVRVDPTSMDVLSETPFDHGPGFIREGVAGIWMSDLHSGELLELDATTGAVLATVDIGGRAGGLVVGDGAVWVADEAGGTVDRVDPVRGAVTASIPVGRSPSGLELAGGRLWVTSFLDGRLVEIDTDAEQVIAEVPVGPRPGGVAFADGSLWVSIHQQGHVLRLDPERVVGPSTRPVPTADHAIDLDDGSQLVIHCIGEGTPTVLLESNVLGVGEWIFVQRDLARSTRVCASDQPSLGLRQGPGAPRSAADTVRELRTGLDQAGIQGPYLLVGHGGGALPVQLFAAQHHDDVVGLALIDALTPGFVAELGARTDAARRSELEADLARPPYERIRESLDQVAAADDIGDLPLLVLAADPSARPDHVAPDLWHEQQEALARTSSKGRLVVADGVGFEIPFHAPGLVVDALVDLLEELRAEI